MKADSKLMKQLNKKQIRDVLIRCGTAAKPDLAEVTGLSVVTVGSLVMEMLESGEVKEAGMAPSGGGRPSVLYRYEPGFRYAALVYGHQDRDRNFIHARVVDLSGQCVWKRDDYCDEVLIDSFDSVLDEMVEVFPRIGILAFGLPGEVVDDVVTVHDYKALIGTEFIRHYRERYQVPVLFENDVNAAAYGAWERHGKQLGKPLAGIYFPRIFPPGAGLVFDGGIYYGAGNFAGELADLPVPVPWRELDYGREDLVAKDIKDLLVILCCTVAPSRFVLYGDFFTKSLEEELRRQVTEFADGKFTVELEVCGSLEDDFEFGMKKLALKQLIEEME